MSMKKSFTLNGGTIFNGMPFTAKHISIIATALNDAFTAGRNSKTKEMKELVAKINTFIKVE